MNLLKAFAAILKRTTVNNPEESIVNKATVKAELPQKAFFQLLVRFVFFESPAAAIFDSKIEKCKVLSGS